jgi:hypothetical protein
VERSKAHLQKLGSALSSLQKLLEAWVSPEESVPIQICVGSHNLKHEIQLLKISKIGKKRNIALDSIQHTSGKSHFEMGLDFGGSFHSLLLFSLHFVYNF